MLEDLKICVHGYKGKILIINNTIMMSFKRLALPFA